MRSVVDYGAGIAVAALLVLALAAGLDAPAPGLHASLRSPGPYRVGPSPGPVDVGPPALVPRIQREAWGGDAVGFTTWNVEYGSRWRRAVTVPTLAGPLDTEHKPWCGMAVRISPGVLDPAQSGPGLVALATREMNAVLPLSLPCGFTRNVHLGKPKTVSVRMTPRVGAIDLEVVAALPDGTQVGAASTVELEVDGQGRLVMNHVGPVKPLFAGPARAQCEGTLKVQLGQLWWRYVKGQRGSIVLATARAEMTRQITPALEALNQALAKLHEPLHPFPGHDVEMTLRLSGPPSVGPDGIGMQICADVDLGEGRVDPRITGTPAVAAAPPPVPPAAAGARIDVNMNAEGINRLIYALWQIGELRRWGTSTEILDQLPSEVTALAFDVTGFDPKLPPVLDAAAGRVYASNIAVGTWGERTVMGHATGLVRMANAEKGLVMTAAVDRMAVNCVQPDGEGWLLTPCLSELLPMVQQSITAKPPRIAIDTGSLVQAIAGHTMHGLALELSPPRVELSGGMLSAQMSVKVGAAPP